MIETTYFARISNRNSPANKLHQTILMNVDCYDNSLIDKPEDLFILIEGDTQRANRTHRRCTPVKVNVSRTHPEKTITNIYISGVVTISLHQVLRKIELRPKAEPAQEAPPPVAPPPAPTPPALTKASQPRIAVLKSRDTDKIERFEFWDKFSGQVQTLLAEGRIWNIYLDNLQIVMAEEYGGKKHLAY